MFERFYKNRYGYSRWDGTQSIEGLDADDILKALSDDYLENGNLQQALKRLMQDGVRSEDGRRAMGLREMMERMRNMRKEQLNRYNMASGVMDDLRQKLEEIKQLEREGIQRRLDDSSADQPSQAGDQPQSEQEGQQGQQPQAGNQSQDTQQDQQLSREPSLAPGATTNQDYGRGNACRGKDEVSRTAQRNQIGIVLVGGCKDESQPGEPDQDDADTFDDLHEGR